MVFPRPLQSITGAAASSHQQPISHEQITQLLQRCRRTGLDFIKIENLYNFDGQAGYSSVSGA